MGKPAHRMCGVTFLECNAAAALAELEIFHPAQLAADRRTTPLFMDNQARPITGNEADKWILNFSAGS